MGRQAALVAVVPAVCKRCGLARHVRAEGHPHGLGVCERAGADLGAGEDGGEVERNLALFPALLDALLNLRSVFNYFSDAAISSTKASTSDKG